MELVAIYFAVTIIQIIQMEGSHLELFNCPFEYSIAIQIRARLRQKRRHRNKYSSTKTRLCIEKAKTVWNETYNLGFFGFNHQEHSQAKWISSSISKFTPKIAHENQSEWCSYHISRGYLSDGFGENLKSILKFAKISETWPGLGFKCNTWGSLRKRKLICDCSSAPPRLVTA